MIFNKYIFHEIYTQQIYILKMSAAQRFALLALDVIIDVIPIAN